MRWKALLLACFIGSTYASDCLSTSACAEKFIAACRNGPDGHCESVVLGHVENEDHAPPTMFMYICSKKASVGGVESSFYSEAACKLYMKNPQLKKVSMAVYDQCVTGGSSNPEFEKHCQEFVDLCTQTKNDCGELEKEWRQCMEVPENCEVFYGSKCGGKPMNPLCVRIRESIDANAEMAVPRIAKHSKACSDRSTTKTEGMTLYCEVVFKHLRAGQLSALASWHDTHCIANNKDADVREFNTQTHEPPCQMLLTACNGHNDGQCATVAQTQMLFEKLPVVRETWETVSKLYKAICTTKDTFHCKLLTNSFLMKETMEKIPTWCLQAYKKDPQGLFSSQYCPTLFTNVGPLIDLCVNVHNFDDKYCERARKECADKNKELCERIQIKIDPNKPNEDNGVKILSPEELIKEAAKTPRGDKRDKLLTEYTTPARIPTFEKALKMACNPGNPNHNKEVCEDMAKLVADKGIVGSVTGACHLQNIRTDSGASGGANGTDTTNAFCEAVHKACAGKKGSCDHLNDMYDQKKVLDDMDDDKIDPQKLAEEMSKYCGKWPTASDMDRSILCSEMLAKTENKAFEKKLAEILPIICADQKSKDLCDKLTKTLKEKPSLNDLYKKHCTPADNRNKNLEMCKTIEANCKSGGPGCDEVSKNICLLPEGKEVCATQIVNKCGARENDNSTVCDDMIDNMVSGEINPEIIKKICEQDAKACEKIVDKILESDKKIDQLAEYCKKNPEETMCRKIREECADPSVKKSAENEKICKEMMEDHFKKQYNKDLCAKAIDQCLDNVEYYCSSEDAEDQKKCKELLDNASLASTLRLTGTFCPKPEEQKKLPSETKKKYEKICKELLDSIARNDKLGAAKDKLCYGSQEHLCPKLSDLCDGLKTKTEKQKKDCEEIQRRAVEIEQNNIADSDKGKASLEGLIKSCRKSEEACKAYIEENLKNKDTRASMIGVYRKKVCIEGMGGGDANSSSNYKDVCDRVSKIAVGLEPEKTAKFSESCKPLVVDELYCRTLLEECKKQNKFESNKACQDLKVGYDALKEDIPKLTNDATPINDKIGIIMKYCGKEVTGMKKQLCPEILGHVKDPNVLKRLADEFCGGKHDDKEMCREILKRGRQIDPKFLTNFFKPNCDQDPKCRAAKNLCQEEPSPECFDFQLAACDNVDDFIECRQLLKQYCGLVEDDKDKCAKVVGKATDHEKKTKQLLPYCTVADDKILCKNIMEQSIDNKPSTILKLFDGMCPNAEKYRDVACRTIQSKCQEAKYSQKGACPQVLSRLDSNFQERICDDTHSQHGVSDECMEAYKKYCLEGATAGNGTDRCDQLKKNFGKKMLAKVAEDECRKDASSQECKDAIEHIEKTGNIEAAFKEACIPNKNKAICDKLRETCKSDKSKEGCKFVNDGYNAPYKMASIIGMIVGAIIVLMGFAVWIVLCKNQERIEKYKAWRAKRKAAKKKRKEQKRRQKRARKNRKKRKNAENTEGGETEGADQTGTEATGTTT